MLKDMRQAVVVFLALTVVTGIGYPLLVTAIAQIVFPLQANGSLIKQDDKIIGSELIGQAFDEPKYFWNRPSATSPAYNAGASSGSNLGPTNPALVDAVKARAENLRSSDPESKEPIPIDMVTASGSGLDPHISPAAMEYQVRRVAKARALSEDQVRSLVARHTEERTWGLLGEPRVNVLLVNLALDSLAVSGNK